MKKTHFIKNAFYNSSDEEERSNLNIWPKKPKAQHTMHFKMGYK